MGIDDAEKRASSSQFRHPRLRLQAGDRARFMFISTGNDEFFEGARFHLTKQQTQSGKVFNKEQLCLRSYTEGEEACSLCDNGHADTGSRFAVWLWVDSIIHPGDNPAADEEGSWPQVKVKAEKDGAERIMFQESVGEPLLLWIPYGRQWAWFGQFKQARDKYGELTGRLYQLRRKGSGMEDTDYVLSVIKESTLPKEAAAAIEETVVTVDQVFRETLTGGPASPSPTKLADELDNAEAYEGPPAALEEESIPALEEEGELI